MHLSLRFLGSFEAQLDSNTSIESRAKRIEALLAFLATESDRAHRRERLVGLLFPEMPDEQARTNLRQTLARLRRTIDDQAADPSFLRISRESTQFNLASKHFLDVADFERLISGCQAHKLARDQNCRDCVHQLEEAAALYRGPFLDGFSIDDSAAFEDWLGAKREQYHQEILAALEQVADYHERGGSYAAATQFVRRLLQIDPWNEKAHRQLMRLLAYQGQRTAALQQYLQLETTLEEELAVEPLAETQRLFESIRSTKDERPYRLPPRNTTFVGRDREVELLHEYLVDPEKRLITLTGPGGSGKTAIASETGWRVADRYLGPFYHGVFFVPLAGIDDQEVKINEDATGFDPMATAVAEAIGFEFSGARHPREQLSRFLQEKSMLLIMDNAEPVLAKARLLIGKLLQQTSGTKILVTSRERLGLGEEWVLEIEGLPYPEPGEIRMQTQQREPYAKELGEEYEAIALFERLGQRLLPGFSLSSESEPRSNPCPISMVERIVHLVQGLPLGIELASSWLRMLSCMEIAKEIEKSLDFLSSTMHDMPSRHRSLRAVFDSSWQLLNEREQQTLRRLSVFHGPFDRAAATTVTGASLSSLGALVDSSMLRHQGSQTGDETAIHYELLDILRQYALEQMARDTAESERIQEEHATYYMNFLAEQQEALRGREQRKSLESISQNIKEIRSAWRWAVQHQDIAALSRALDVLGLYYYMRSWFVEGADLFTLAARELEVDQHSPVWARLRARQGWFTFLQGNQQEGHEQLRESIDILRAAGEPADLAFALSFTAAALAIMGKYDDARELAEESLTINEQCQDAYGRAISGNVLSQIAYQVGAYTLAKQHSEASLAIERALGNQWSIGFSLANLGRAAFAQEAYADAGRFFQESLSIRKALADRRGQALCYRYLGETAQAKGEIEEAQKNLEESLAIFRSIGSQDETSATLSSLGDLAIAQNDAEKAQRYFVQSLENARAVEAAPRMLPAILGLARLFVHDDPKEAARIAMVVRNHPAVDKQSSRRADDLLRDLKRGYAQAAATGAAAEHAAQLSDLDTLVEHLLAIVV